MQGRDLTLGQSNDLYVGVGHALEYAGDIFLIAGEAIHRLGQHHLEPPAQGVGDQRLDAGTQKRCTGNRVVRILLDDLPALLLRIGAADAKLVRD